MMKKLFLVLTLTLLLLAGQTSAASAKTLMDDEVVAGGDYTLAEDETLNGNLVVLGGSVTLEEGSTVNGSVVIVGGSSELGGEVKEDVVVFGGSVALLETVVIQGDLVRSGGSIEAEAGYEVQGNETQSIPNPPVLPFDNNSEFSAPEVPANPVQDGIEGMVNAILSLVLGVISAFTLAVVAGVLAMFVAMLMPEPLGRVTAAMTQAPVLSAGMGLLTLVAVPMLAGLVALITLFCLSPFSLVALFIYVMAIFFGWVALGALMGEKLMGAVNNGTFSPVLAAGLGAFLLTLLINLLSVIPGIGGFFSSLTAFLLAALGLGAVVLTRFGLRPYLSGVAAPVQPAPPPPAAEA